MKILLDTCVWGGAKEVLEKLGHDVKWTGDWETDPGDEAILTFAHRQGRALVTLDKDFGELAIVRGFAHFGIVRLVGISARQQGEACAEIMDRFANELKAGALITVGPSQVRIRPGGTAE